MSNWQGPRTYLVGSTALVGTKHDDIGRRVRKFLGVESLIVLEELHISTTTFQSVYKHVSGRQKYMIVSVKTYSEA